MTGRPRKDSVEQVRHDNSEGRKRRTKGMLGVQKQKMAFNIPEGKVGRIFNGSWMKDPSRLQDAMDAGYRFATYKDGVITDDTAESVGEAGNNVTVKVGVNKDGSEIVGYLMLIDKEFYDEDQEIKQAVVDNTDSRIKRGELDNNVPRDKSYSSVKYKPK